MLWSPRSKNRGVFHSKLQTANQALLAHEGESDRKPSNASKKSSDKSTCQISFFKSSYMSSKDCSYPPGPGLA